MGTCRTCRHWDRPGLSHFGDCKAITPRSEPTSISCDDESGVTLNTYEGFGCILYSREFDRRGHPIGNRKSCTWGCSEGMYSRPDGSAFPCNHCEGTGYLPEARDENV